MSAGSRRTPVTALSAAGRFAYDFLVGDDWTVAAGMALVLAVVYVMAHHGGGGWWLVPLAVASSLAWSVQRACRPGR